MTGRCFFGTNDSNMMKRLFIPIDFCLLTLIAYLAVDTFYFGFDCRTDAARLPAAAETAVEFDSQAFHPPFSQYLMIMKENMFKTGAAERRSVSDIDVASLEQTGLELVLLGTVVSEQGQSYAVIRQKKEKSQGLYREGDSIEGAEIKIILKEEVVLRVDGKDEILRMDAEGSGERSKGPAMAAERPPERAYRRIPGKGQYIVLKRNEIEAAVSDVNELMTQAQITPRFKEGEPGESGLFVSAIKKDSIFRRMGLRNGDIIKGVDGRELRSVDDAFSLYRQLKDSDSVNVQVIRRGKEICLDYVIE